jgi:peroxiredoxin Q/BCP
MLPLGALISLVLVATPKVGEVAPDFTAKDSQGQTLKLSDLLKKGPVVLAFFPKSSTSG